MDMQRLPLSNAEADLLSLNVENLLLEIDNLQKLCENNGHQDVSDTLETLRHEVITALSKMHNQSRSRARKRMEGIRSN